jgi:membrane fusion protein, multidrug efflux system
MWTQLLPKRNLLCGVAQNRLAYLFFMVTAVLLIASGCADKQPAAAPSPPEVQTADVIQQDVPIYTEWVAQLNGDTNAQIMPKVQGYVLTKDYNEGSYVRKGELLFQIDPRPFQAALDQAKAQLALAHASLSKAETDVARDAPLAAQNAIPQKQLDNDRAAQAAGKAQVQAGDAQVEQAELNLAWTKVYSPIDGISGTANSQVGDLVGTTTKMTTVSKVNPIRAYFSVSENAYLGAAKEINAAMRAPNLKSGSPPVEYIQSNEVRYPQKGRVILVNREVSAQTGTIQVAAEFANPDAILRPGGFGRVRMKTGDNKNALLVPQRAVQEVQSAYQVVVVGPDNKVAFRPVKVAEKVGPNWVVTEGLKPGEKVVVEGFMKLREGMPVSAKPYVESASVGSN